MTTTTVKEVDLIGEVTPTPVLCGGISVGVNAKRTGNFSIAIGDNSEAKGDYDVSLTEYITMDPTSYTPQVCEQLLSALTLSLHTNLLIYPVDKVDMMKAAIGSLMRAVVHRVNTRTFNETTRYRLCKTLTEESSVSSCTSDSSCSTCVQGLEAN